MRTFAQKQNQSQKPVSSSLVRSNAAIPRPNHRVNPLLHLQHTTGDQAAPRTLRTNGEELKAGLNVTASPFLGHDFSPVPIHPPTAIQPRLKVGEPNDKFEQEADRVADKVMNMPEALPPATAISASALIQSELGGVNQPHDRISLKEEDKKAELEFHSTVAFDRTQSDLRRTGPPAEEGFAAIAIRWAVWNTGWETAPVHVDRLTIYKADRCSGCRDEKDELLSMDVTAPSIVSITQQSESEYEGINPIVGMTFRAGHYDAYVDLDIYDEVEEINEDNNTAFMTFYVKPRNKSEPETEGEEDTVQKKDAGPAPDAGPDVESQISGLRGGGQPLPQSLRDFFEPRFGYDFSRVRIHSDARAAESARKLQAKAFTVGRDVIFGEGQHAVATPEGRHLLAHELTHVVQQTKPTPSPRPPALW